MFNLRMINQYKSYGVKVIGIFHGVYISQMFNNCTMFYRDWKNVDNFDAYIHIAADDYFFLIILVLNGIFLYQIYTHLIQLKSLHQI